MNETTIRHADHRDLPRIYELAARAFIYDKFSPDLLAEKLFEHRLPDEFQWRVYLLERDDRLLAFMQSAVRPAAQKAWIGLFAVTLPERRRGHARSLFQRARADWSDSITEIEALAIPVNYFTPGLDPRYTPALCFFENLGFERFRDCVNLEADLAEPFEVAGDERRLADAGYEIRRASPADQSLLADFFSKNFGPDWLNEALLALRHDPPILHLALSQGQIVAFSASASQNREWGFFGPMGTTPAVRGQGVGRLLLRRCLNDLRAAGHKTALIPWVGPISFYSQWSNARVTRVFWRYKLTTKS